MIKKILTLGVAGLMLFSVIALSTSASVYAQKPTDPGKSEVSNGKKYQQADPIVIVVTDETTNTTTKQTTVVDDGTTNKPSTPANAENKVAVEKKKTADSHKVTICHRTNSAKNPYVKITVDSHAVDGVAGNSGNKADHYGEHQGPIASSFEVATQLKKDKVEWGDIIPPVAPHSGQNWTSQGQAMLKNGCNFTTPSNTSTPDDEDGDVLGGNPSGSGEVLPGQLPNTGSGSPAFILMMIAALSALVGLGGSIVRLVLTRNV